MIATGPLRVRAAGLELTVVAAPPAPRRTPSREPGRGAALLERACTVRIDTTDTGTIVDLGSFGTYGYAPADRVASVLAPPVDPVDVSAALEGPILFHALAHAGIHVLHAGALADAAGRAVALTAGSGAGKSTITAQARRHGWRRLADDLLPLTRDGDAWVVRPHLPQPKLARQEQYPHDAPRDVPLAAIVELARGPAARWDDHDAATLTRLLLSATVATRTYTAAMLAAHLEFCAAAGRAAAAGQLVAGRLTVANRPTAIADAVDEALRLLAARIAQRPARSPSP